MFDRLSSALSRGLRHHPSVKTGRWAKIGKWVTLEEGVILGDWSHVGDGSRIGPCSVLGSWARVGENVNLGARVHLGSHTRIQDGVTVPDDTVFGDADLVTRDEVIPARCGGHAMQVLREGVFVSAVFGKFLIPLDKSDPEDLLDRLLDDHQWGRSDALEPCRCLRRPRPEEEDRAFRIVRSRLEAHRLGVWPSSPFGIANCDRDLPGPETWEIPEP